VNQVPADTDIVVAHEGLAERARKAAPAAVVLTFKNFMNNTASDKLVKSLEAGDDITSDSGPTR
jgi:mannitol-specific phosphotransferase system IIBC component